MVDVVANCSERLSPVPEHLLLVCVHLLFHCAQVRRGRRHLE